MRRRLAALLLVPFLALGACADEADDGPLGADDETSEEAPTGSDNGTGDGAAVAGVTVTLLDPGAEPRQVLRLDPPDDCELPSVQGTRQAISIEAGPEAQAIDQAFELDVTYRCADLAEDRIEVDLDIDDVRILDAPPETEGALEDVFESIVGETGHAAYDRRGGLLEMSMPTPDLPGAARDVAEDTNADLQSQAANLAAPLPEEPVGVGARWQVESAAVVGGMAVDQITTFTLTQIDGDRVTAESVVELRYEPGAIEVPGGESAEVVSGHLSGTGTTTWDLTEPVALTSSVMEGTIEMAVEAGGERLELRQDMRMEQEIRRR